MPVYCYKCTDCDFEFEAKHSMSFDSQRCQKCDSVNVFKLPALLPSAPAISLPKRTGSVVVNHIEDARREVNKEKKRLSSEEM